MSISCLAIIAIHLTAAAATTVTESEREIPIVHDVDVVVVGGSSGAVAAAVAASDQGAEVFLAAPRPYLGEDICGAYRFWLDEGEEPRTQLASDVFTPPPAIPFVGDGLPFTYEADKASAPQHKDSEPSSMLCDGKWTSAYTDSVQYDGDVSIVADLGKEIALGTVHVLAFQRDKDIELARVAVSVSSDRQEWREVAVIENDKLGKGQFIDTAIHLSAALDVTGRYVKFAASKGADAQRMLLGEIAVEAKETEPENRAAQDRRVPPTPMHVKRTLDNALLAADVRFLYGCYVTDVLRDARGRVAGVVMANRAGRQAVRAKVIIDATPRADVARIAGAPFHPYAAGTRVFKRVVAGGEGQKGPAVKALRELAPMQIGRDAGSKQPYCAAYEYTLEISMADASFASYAKAEQVARDATWDPGQLGASETLFEVPADPMIAEAGLDGPWPGADKARLGAFRPKGEPRIYVLGGCADTSRDAAEALMRPVNLMEMGERIGLAAAADVSAKPRARVVCFGDSITAAGYPDRLEDLIPGASVFNAGVGGDTTGQGLTRMESDVLSHNPQVVVVLFGANDSCMTGPGKFNTPLDEYEANLREIVGRCAAKNAKAILCTPLPMIEEPYFERHPKEYYDAEGGLEAVLGKYRAVVLKVGEAMGVPVVDLHSAFPKNFGSLRPCGVHPNTTGEKTVASLVAEGVRPFLPEPRRERKWRGVRVAASREDGDSVAGDVREILAGVRSTQHGLPTVPSGKRAIPVLGEYDVVVVGGGTGGAPAGIAAARHGAKTLVVEYLNGLGGVGTLGLIGVYYHGFRDGFTAEIDQGVDAMGPDGSPRKHAWHIEWKMEWYRRELRRAGADTWFGALGCGAYVEDGRVRGVVVATPRGRGVVLAKVVIDSTGNSDIAAAAGATCMYTDGSDVAVQGTGLPPRQPGAYYTNTDYTMSDDTDMMDVWRLFVMAKGKYAESYDLGQLIDTRERRRIVGDMVVSPVDIQNHRTYPDTVVMATSDFDTHGFTVHPVFALRAPDRDGATAYIPYGSLLPKGLDGIIVTGLGISAHRDAMPILRMQPDIQNQGYAAGTAAAMAALNGLGARDIDIRQLQRHLVDIGNLPESVLTDTDSYPISDEDLARAVDAVANGYEGINVILARIGDAMPLLRKACESAASDQARLVYAHILGMHGDPTGAATLASAVDSMEWDPGWTFTGGGQYGASVSPLDSLIIALGRTRSKDALEPILRKVSELTADSEFSHHRAVAMALESLGDPAATQALAALLMKPGMAGHAVTSIEDAKDAPENPNQTRDRSLRELILARALYRCGDYHGLGEKTLKEYARDLRGHHSRHAIAVLSGRSV